MSNVPDDLHYTESHEWVRVEGDVATIGITDHAQEALNDIVFVELPAVGKVLTPGQEFGVVESVKSVSELYSPVAGRVVAVNDGLDNQPELVNQDAYGKGWLIQVKLAGPPDSLLDAEDYRTVIG